MNREKDSQSNKPANKPYDSEHYRCSCQQT